MGRSMLDSVTRAYIVVCVLFFVVAVLVVACAPPPPSSKAVDPKITTVRMTNGDICYVLYDNAISCVSHGS